MCVHSKRTRVNSKATSQKYDHVKSYQIPIACKQSGHGLKVVPVIGFSSLNSFQHSIPQRLPPPVLGGQKLPILLQGSFVDLLTINLYSGGVVWLQDQAIDMRSAFIVLLVCQIRLLQHILPLVVEDEMCTSGFKNFEMWQVQVGTKNYLSTARKLGT